MAIVPVVGAIVLLAAVSAAALVWRRKCPFLMVGWFWFLGMLVPVIGLVQVGQQSMADRYTYLPHIGLAIALAWSVCSTGVSRKLVKEPPKGGTADGGTTNGVVAAIVLAVLMGCTWRQTSYWRNSETLWTHALHCNPGNGLAHSCLANALSSQGRMADAAIEYRAALELDRSATRTNTVAFTCISKPMWKIGRKIPFSPHELKNIIRHQHLGIPIGIPSPLWSI